MKIEMKMMLKHSVVVVLLTLLAACGQKGPLKPAVPAAAPASSAPVR
jgi:predicted small lipoprotein YifL